MPDVLRINPAVVPVTIRATIQVVIRATTQAFNPLIGRVVFHLHYHPNNPRVDPADSPQLTQPHSHPRKSQNVCIIFKINGLISCECFNFYVFICFSIIIIIIAINYSLIYLLFILII